MLAVWDGGLAFFGGLFCAIGAAWLYTRRVRLPFNTNGRPVRARRADRGQGSQGTALARAWRGQGEDVVVEGVCPIKFFSLGGGPSCCQRLNDWLGRGTFATKKFLPIENS